MQKPYKMYEGTGNVDPNTNTSHRTHQFYNNQHGHGHGGGHHHHHPQQQPGANANDVYFEVNSDNQRRNFVQPFVGGDRGVGVGGGGGGPGGGGGGNVGAQGIQGSQGVQGAQGGGQGGGQGGQGQGQQNIINYNNNFNNNNNNHNSRFRHAREQVSMPHSEMKQIVPEATQWLPGHESHNSQSWQVGG